MIFKQCPICNRYMIPVMSETLLRYKCVCGYDTNSCSFTYSHKSPDYSSSFNLNTSLGEKTLQAGFCSYGGRKNRMRLVDIDKLKDVKFQDSANLYKWGWNSAIDAIFQAPTVDAVEVVRCENCKHYDEQVWDRKGRGRCNSQHIDMLPTDYCSYGERKNET